MRIDLRAKVRTRDGHDAGRIERAVYDPESKEITKFLISTGGLFGHEVLVPRSAVDQPTRDGDIVVLELTKDELKTMERYVPQRYLPPPAAWEPPPGAAFAYLAGDYLWPVGVSDEALEVEAGEV